MKIDRNTRNTLLFIVFIICITLSYNNWIFSLGCTFIFGYVLGKLNRTEKLNDRLIRCVDKKKFINKFLRYEL